MDREQVATLLGLTQEQKQALKNYSAEEEEVLYASAYGLYASGQYKAAADLFTQLILNAPFVEKYWKGFASCKQMLTEYKAALQAWSVLALLCEKDPWAHFHAAECLLTMGQKQEALKALNCTKSLLGASEDHLALNAKIELLKESCK